MNRAFFVTGTDTDCGKTMLSSALLCAFSHHGLRTVGMKPIASGSSEINHHLRNSDVEMLRANASVKLDRQILNPYRYRAAVSPHFAARDEGPRIQLETILNAYQQCCAQADVVIIEGVGGWRVPLDDGLETVDLVRALNIPVVLVCGIKLGGINHAVLTAEAIKRDGVTLEGWIANQIVPEYQYAMATLETLESRIEAPLIAQIAWQPVPTPHKMAQQKDILAWCGLNDA